MIIRILSYYWRFTCMILALTILMPATLSAQFMRVSLNIPAATFTNEPEWVELPGGTDSLTLFPIYESLFGFDLAGQENLQIQLSLRDDSSSLSILNRNMVQLCYRNDGKKGFDSYLNCPEVEMNRVINFPISNRPFLIRNMDDNPAFLVARVWVKCSQTARPGSNSAQDQSVTLHIEFN
jgi:hypothetical protein